MRNFTYPVPILTNFNVKEKQDLHSKQENA